MSVITFYIVLRQTLLFASVYTRLAGLRASRFSYLFPRRCHRNAEITDLCYCFWLYTGSGDPNFGFLDPEASVFHTEPPCSHSLYICPAKPLPCRYLFLLSPAFALVFCLCVLPGLTRSDLVKATNFQPSDSPGSYQLFLLGPQLIPHLLASPCSCPVDCPTVS